MQARLAALQTTPQSFFEVAESLIGGGEGSRDVSTNPDYMRGYGQRQFDGF